MKLPEGKSRLDLVREGLTTLGLTKRGRLVVSLDRVREDPRNERKTFHNMEGLIASVREHGIVEPITVTPEGDAYVILTGHRRFRAARAAGLAEVEVLIRDPESDSQRRLKSLISNVQREDLSAVELAEALQSILAVDTTIGTQQELGRRIGRSRQWVSEMLNVLSLPTDLQLRIRESDTPLSYDSIMKIAHVRDTKQQAQLLDAALQGESSRSIRDRAKSARDTSSASRPRGRSLNRTVRVQESFGGYTAIVSGPVAPDAHRSMRAVVEALLDRIEHGLN